MAAGPPAIVMELIEGPTLADRLSSGPLALDVALEIAGQIAEALEAAHEKGVIHLDLKPANIKFTATGTVKVLDFGLAKAMAPDAREVRMVPADGAAASGEGVVAGTPGYMSPEQARGERVDARSDVWAFGCRVVRDVDGATGVRSRERRRRRYRPSWSAIPIGTVCRRMCRRAYGGCCAVAWNEMPDGASITSPTRASR